MCNEAASGRTHTRRAAIRSPTGSRTGERRFPMPGVEARGFDAPDETRTPDKTKVDVVRMSGATAARMTFEPGWRWSECVKPVVGTDSCQARHVGVAQTAR